MTFETKLHWVVFLIVLILVWTNAIYYMQSASPDKQAEAALDGIAVGLAMSAIPAISFYIVARLSKWLLCPDKGILTSSSNHRPDLS